MVMMNHNIIDYNLMYYYAVFNINAGIADGYVEKIQKPKSRR